MEQIERINKTFEQFESAFARLNEAVEITPENTIKRDAVIQRFEFTYELLWKLIKKIAQYEKADCYSPKSCFRFAFEMGLVSDEELFADIIDARNLTTHIYSEQEIEKIYVFIKEKIIKAFADSRGKIKAYLDTANLR